MTEVHFLRTSWEPILSVSYRRRHLDSCLEAARPYMKGRVLDVGGKKIDKRGNFQPSQMGQWYTFNIITKDCPDFVSDAHYIPLEDNAFDTLICTEVLEHIAEPQQVVSELSRILRPKGHLILSVPFLVPVHGDPFDFQRFTDQGLRRIFNDHGFRIISLHAMGLFFTVLVDIIRFPISKIELTSLRWCLGFPLIITATFLLALEKMKFVNQNPLLRSYTTGYFVIACKSDE
jgi:SAM-dependent methyltransferase